MIPRKRTDFIANKLRGLKVPKQFVTIHLERLQLAKETRRAKAEQRRLEGERLSDHDFMKM